MALVFWLTGNDGNKNQGISDTQVWSDVVINYNGKTGNSIAFNDMAFISLETPTPEYTVSFWVSVVNSTTSLNLTINTSTSSMNLRVERFEMLIDGFDFTHRFDDKYGWVHVLITCDSNGKKSLYIDGESMTTIEVTPESLSGFMVQGGNICDFRVYDEVLPAKRINMIKSGLVRHYTLDNSANQTEFGLADTSGLGSPATAVCTKPLVNGKTIVGRGSFAPDGSNYLNCGNIPFDGHECGINVWVYLDEWFETGDEYYDIISSTDGGVDMFVESGSVIVVLTLDFDIPVDDDGNTFGNIGYFADTLDVTPGWHMITFNFKNIPCGVYGALYIDGKLYSDGEYDFSGMGTTFPIHNYALNEVYIGRDDTKISKDVCIADLRIYSTMIEDPARMYKSRIEIGNDSTLYGYGIDDTKSDLGLFSTGLISGDITEGYDQLRIYQDHINCKEYVDM